MGGAVGTRNGYCPLVIIYWSSLVHALPGWSGIFICYNCMHPQSTVKMQVGISCRHSINYMEIKQDTQVFSPQCMSLTVIAYNAKCGGKNSHGKTLGGTLYELSEN